MWSATLFTLADRIVQLDHMTRGRLIFGVGAGALAQDSLMMGRDLMESRRRMEEAVEVIERLLACDGPVDAETDWFTLRGAQLHLRPCSDEIDVRVACFRSPSGPRLAGRFGAGMLQFGASAAIGGGSENPMITAWGQAQARARELGRTVDRSRWSVVSPVHVAPTEAQARAEVAWGLPHHVRFVRQVLPLNVPVDLDDVDAVIDVLQTVGHMVVGTPDQAAAHIAKMQEISGGFGTFVIEHGELAQVSTGRTQFSSKQTVGDRWIFMSHAGFLAALADDDLSAERFAYVDTLNRALLDNNDKLIAGSYISFRDLDLWRAWSKMWFLAWNLGVMRIAGSYCRYLETGDVTELDRLHAGVLPGTWAPELAFLLGDGEASPSPLILHDVLRGWHDGSAEAQKLLYRWGRTAGPEALRPYFAYDRATIALAAEKVLSAGRAVPDPDVAAEDVVVDVREPAPVG